MHISKNINKNNNNKFVTYLTAYMHYRSNIQTAACKDVCMVNSRYCSKQTTFGWGWFRKL